ncbi:unnamed protein product [Bursaphelenchus xylophilus]|uniref:(pine wood nematode) hypothetical protein n=1 Tax=Bursaphelenchus xylophilus TaxID=6326 RepID=A0A7I8WH33_BURXY|nr:unnamed protein product [Bursaphelenchus xylophilus]CAG9110265.1 unnamed protein product [Bursaphelenchus xylophilus]
MIVLTRQQPSASVIKSTEFCLMAGELEQLPKDKLLGPGMLFVDDTHVNQCHKNDYHNAYYSRFDSLSPDYL